MRTIANMPHTSDLDYWYISSFSEEAFHHRLPLHTTEGGRATGMAIVAMAATTPTAEVWDGLCGLR